MSDSEFSALIGLPVGFSRELIIGSRLVRVPDGQLSPAASPLHPTGTWSFPSATTADALAALDAASKAQPTWRRWDVADRCAMVARLADLLQENSDVLIRVMTLESGKARRWAALEVAATVRTLKYMAGLAPQLPEQLAAARFESSISMRQLRPVGPALLITPWNFPLSLASKKLASALIAGCTVLLKPSELTPITGLLLGRYALEAGVPDGVVSVLPTSDSPSLVASLTESVKLRKVSFTGSTRVGREVHKATSRNFQRLSLELGGNAPSLVLPDAEPAEAARMIWAAKVHNSGQACTAPNRAFIPESLVPVLRAEFENLIASTGTGDPSLDETSVGPLISAGAVSRLQGFLSEVSGEMLSSASSFDNSAFMAPTVAFDASIPASLSDEELFGPVLPVIVYRDNDLAGVIERANESNYGLAAYVYSGDPDAAMEVASELDVGMVAINRSSPQTPLTPFGGVKHSGFGRENGVYGILEFVETHAIVTDE